MSQTRRIQTAVRAKTSAGGADDRNVSTRDVATYFREDCRTLSDSLQLEMVVAQYWLRIRDVRTPEGIPIGVAVGPGVVAALERERDPLSLAILRGIGHIAAGDLAMRSADAAARLAEAGIQTPPEFADVGCADPVGAWRANEGGFPGQYCFFAEFEHPTGRRHSVIAFVHPRRGDVVKHLGLIGPMSEVDREGPFSAGVMEPLTLTDAGELLDGLLTRTFGPAGAASDDYQVPIAVARARTMLAAPTPIARAAAGRPPGRSTRSRD